MANVTIRPRRDTTANWELYNPILADKEMAFEVVATGSPVKMKIGDGYTAWTSLDYAVDFQTIETLVTKATTGAEDFQALGTLTTATTIDCSLGAVVTATIGASLAFTFTANSDGLCRTLTLELTNAGSYVITFPTSVKWAYNIAPTLSTYTDILTFITTDNGVSWIGMPNVLGVQ